MSDLFRTCPTAGSASGLPPLGHCFVVGARHQLRASMSAGWRGSAGQVRRNFRQSSPHRTTGFFFHGCRLRRQPRHFFFPWEESRPWARQGSDAGQARPGGYARQECGALGVGRARTHWASHQTRLGEPVLIGRATQLSQRPPRLLQSCACLARCLECLLGTSSACSARLVPARHRGACACSARLVKCQLGTASACSARSAPTYKCPLGTSTYKCPLGTVPARHV